MKYLYGALLAGAMALPVQAQETINLTVAASHPLEGPP